MKWIAKNNCIYDEWHNLIAVCSFAPNVEDANRNAQLIAATLEVTADRDRWKKLCLELFASHKELLIEGMNLYEYYPNSHRKTVEKYFAEELELQNKIEEAISKQMEAGDA
jgi:hypothetical protein